VAAEHVSRCEWEPLDSHSSFVGYDCSRCFSIVPIAAQFYPSWLQLAQPAGLVQYSSPYNVGNSVTGNCAEMGLAVEVLGYDHDYPNYGELMTRIAICTDILPLYRSNQRISITYIGLDTIGTVCLSMQADIVGLVRFVSVGVWILVRLLLTNSSRRSR
jgi:hypothetical protein